MTAPRVWGKFCFFTHAFLRQQSPTVSAAAGGWVLPRQLKPGSHPARASKGCAADRLLHGDGAECLVGQHQSMGKTFFFRTFFRQLEGVPSLRPQGQATVALRGSVVDDAVERRAFASLRLQRLPPGTSKSRTGDCLLHRDRKHAPPAPRPSCCRCRAHGEGRAVRLETHQVSHEASGLSVPAAAHLGAEHDERLRPPSRELRVRGVLRRSATRSTAPSTAAAHGCGCPDRVSGETSVASQHCAPPLRSAPYTTRSSLRRSCASTCGAVALASHCCGTT